jgi:hypothetical protein
MDVVKKQAVGGLEGWNASFDSLGCHLKKLMIVWRVKLYFP